MLKKKKVEAIEFAIADIKRRIFASDHSKSLAKFTELASGFVYLDTWGIEHTVLFNIKDDKSVDLHCISNPLPDCYFSDELDKMYHTSFTVELKDLDVELDCFVHDHFYRDDTELSGCGKPYSMH